MTKGTTSKGERHTKAHTECRRCGRISFHMQKQRCASCSYPAASMRRYNWSVKQKGRRTQGVGRLRSLKSVHRRFTNGFREGTVAKPKAKKTTAVTAA